VVTSSREGGDVKGFLLTAIIVLALAEEYIPWSYSRSTQVICITLILDIASKAVRCPLAGIHRNRTSIE